MANGTEIVAYLFDDNFEIDGMISLEFNGKKRKFVRVE